MNTPNEGNIRLLMHTLNEYANVDRKTNSETQREIDAYKTRPLHELWAAAGAQSPDLYAQYAYAEYALGHGDASGAFSMLNEIHRQMETTTDNVPGHSDMRLLVRVLAAIGLCRVRGIGTEQDPEQGKAYLMTAALELNDAFTAHVMLSLCSGDAVELSETEISKLAGTVADGFPADLLLIANCFRKCGARVNAAAYYQKAAMGGDALAAGEALFCLNRMGFEDPRTNLPVSDADWEMRRKQGSTADLLALLYLRTAQGNTAKAALLEHQARKVLTPEQMQYVQAMASALRGTEADAAKAPASGSRPAASSPRSSSSQASASPRNASGPFPYAPKPRRNGCVTVFLVVIGILIAINVIRFVGNSYTSVFLPHTSSSDTTPNFKELFADLAPASSAVSDAASAGEEAMSSEEVAPLTAQGSLYGLDVTVEQVSDTVYAVHCSNDTESTFNLGWVGGPLVTVVTDAGEFSSDIPAHMGIVIESGGTYDYQLELPGASGVPQTVSIDKCYILGDRGLPENQMNCTLSMQFA